jgi:hypothetical protein
MTVRELSLLAIICDKAGAELSDIPDNMQENLKSLVQRKLLVVTEDEFINPTQKGLMIINTAKSEMNFQRMLSQMNNRMLINLIHRAVELARDKGLHLNVVFKNLEDKDFNYVFGELVKAQKIREERKEQLEIIQ